jgi:hypothetical protein
MRILSIIALILLGIPSLAAAQATLQIRLSDSAGRPVDGTVTLTGPGQVRRCVTTAGRCTLTAPAGSYTATVAPRRGTAPPARPVTVPAAGVVTVALSLPPDPAPPTAGSGLITTQTMGTGGTTSSSGGTTSTGGTGTTAIAGTPTTRIVTGTTVTPMPAPRPATRNLATGTRLVASGQVVDSAGRPVDATITVLQGATTIGTANTTAARFSLFDLTSGAYTVQATTRAGRTARTTLTVGAATARLTVRVP